MPDYNQLLADIPAWLEDAAPELVLKVPQFISFAEKRCARELQVRQFNAILTGTMTVALQTYLFPTDMEAMRSFEIKVGNNSVTLEKRMREWMKFYWPDVTEVGVPKYYGVNDDQNFMVVPTPGVAYQYVINYRRRLPALGPLNLNNWLTDEAYDAILYASLAQAAKFLLSDKRDSLAESYETEWGKIRDAINRSEARVMRDEERQPGVLQANV